MIKIIVLITFAIVSVFTFQCLFALIVLAGVLIKNSGNKVPFHFKVPIAFTIVFIIWSLLLTLLIIL